MRYTHRQLLNNTVTRSGLEVNNNSSVMERWLMMAAACSQHPTAAQYF
jgi:hypothetical protein